MTEFVLALALGILFAVGTFLVLRRDIVRVVWGVVILSQSANVYLVTMGFGPTGGGTAPILSGHGGGGAGTVDPLVQALVLTAIVIGFGTTAFALVVTYRVYEEHGSINLRDVADWRPGPQETTEHPGGEEGEPPEAAGTEVTDD